MEEGDENCGRWHGAALPVRDREGWKGQGVAAALPKETAPPVPVASDTAAADWLMMLGDFYCNTRLESRLYWP